MHSTGTSTAPSSSSPADTYDFAIVLHRREVSTKSLTRLAFRRHFSVGDTGDEPPAPSDDSTNYLRTPTKTAGADSGAIQILYHSDSTKPFSDAPSSPLITAILTLVEQLTPTDRATLVHMLLNSMGTEGDWR
jgi:hypothetical protein